MAIGKSCSVRRCRATAGDLSSAPDLEERGGEHAPLTSPTGCVAAVPDRPHDRDRAVPRQARDGRLPPVAPGIASRALGDCGTAPSAIGRAGRQSLGRQASASAFRRSSAHRSLPHPPRRDEVEGLGWGSSLAGVFAAVPETAARARFCRTRRPGMRTPLWQQRSARRISLPSPPCRMCFPRSRNLRRCCATTSHRRWSHARRCRHERSGLDHRFEVAIAFAACCFFSYVKPIIYYGDAPLPSGWRRRCPWTRRSCASCWATRARELLDPVRLAPTRRLQPSTTVQGQDRGRPAVCDSDGDLSPRRSRHASPCRTPPASLRDLERARRIVSLAFAAERRRLPRGRSAVRYALFVPRPPVLLTLLEPCAIGRRFLGPVFAPRRTVYGARNRSSALGLAPAVAEALLLRPRSGKADRSRVRPGAWSAIGTRRSCSAAAPVLSAPAGVEPLTPRRSGFSRCRARDRVGAVVRCPAGRDRAAPDAAVPFSCSKARSAARVADYRADMLAR